MGDINLSAQEVSPPTGSTDIVSSYSAEVLNVHKVSTLITEIEGKTELDEALRAKLLEKYRAALYQLALSQQHKNETEILKRYIEATPEETRKLREQLLEAQKSDIQNKPLPADISEYTTSRELELRLAKEQADLTALKNKVTGIKAEIQQLQMRPDNIQSELVDAKQRLDEYTETLKAGLLNEENPTESNARIILLQARQSSALHEINKLEQELMSHDVKRELLLVTRDVFNIKVSYTEHIVKAIEDMVNQFREKEVKQASLAAEADKHKAIDKHPAVKGLAGENAEYTSELTDVAHYISKITPQRTSLSDHLKQLKLDYENAKKQIEIAGNVDEALVQIMLDQRRRLPDLNGKRKINEEIRKKVIAARLRRFRLDEQIRPMSNIPLEAARIMSEKVQKPVLEADGKDIENEITVLLTKKSELLSKLDAAYGSLLKSLGEFHSELNQYIENVQVYASFMDEQLMWVPSSPPFSKLTWHKLISSFNWLFSPYNWKELGIASLSIFTNAPVLSGIAILIAFWLFSTRIKLKKGLEAISNNIGKISTDHFKHTLLALLITILSAIPFPFILVFFSWQLLKIEESVEFVKACGFGLLFTSWFMLSFQFFRAVCYKKGLGETHFKWKKTTLKVLRNNLFWLLMIVSIASFFTTLVEYQSNNNFRDSLGRLGFIIGMAAFTVFIQRVIQPKKGIFGNIISENPNGWLTRMTWLWYPAAVLLPVSLVGLAAFGYYYVAYQLGLKLLQTLWILFGAVIAYYIGIRWFYIKERKLALEQALERRKAAAAAKSVAEGTIEITEVALPQFEEPVVNLSAVKEQTRNLLRSFIGFSVIIGIWIIWATVLPALNVLYKINLWSHTVVIDGSPALQWVTLFHLMLCLVVGVTTAVVAKNLPGVLEIAILQNLPIQTGSRYAITSISQYIIVTIGLVSISKIMGVNWAQFGWLFAALSVGIGFGLQEIVANFVCGIVLFIERPIRVGDIITVSDVSGTVTKIQIRATTITNWDRQEFVVPNKEFITGRILNWTLSNTTNRFTIDVGIAYGSDVERARELLLQIAGEHPAVLKDPAPFAMFQKFEDSSLHMSLRCYLPNLDKRLATIHELHSDIHRRFKEAGIEIAFPQRDIHVKNTDNVVKESEGQQFREK
ncbi:MscS mechanosensitive ion channel [Candidatus Scalindua japonica]|uniref:MscS mechanosensitive ion channel n=2 Tax=Candidatus Scalindua japonica TaxID=1284222 RepID=A0A286U4H0_9BACT|nr:MscS mechanosensitive ion channel [Candidatus Scalindua japonica]